MPSIFASLEEREPTLCVSHVSLMSLDGSIAQSPNESDELRRSYGFGCGADRDFVESCLCKAEAVVISGATLRVAGSMWQTPNAPKWFVVSEQLKDLTPWGVGELISGADPVESIVSECKKYNLKKIVLLCGGQLAKLFYEKGVVSELFMTIAPYVLGVSSRVPAFPSHPQGLNLPLKLQAVSEDQGHVFLCYYL
ncbi:MAG: dihydrofolate reductase family protein [Oligoflexales bacterium]